MKIKTVGDLLNALKDINKNTPIAACWEGQIRPIQAFAGSNFVVLNVDGYDWTYRSSESEAMRYFTKESIADAASYWEG